MLEAKAAARRIKPVIVRLGISRRNSERIPQFKPGDVLEIGFVPGHERDVILQGSGGDDGITQRHFLLLAQFDCLFNDPIIQRIDGASVDEVKNCVLLLRRNSREPKGLDSGDARDPCLRVSGPWTQPFSTGLAGIDDNIRIQKHDLNRGSGADGPPAFHIATLRRR